MVKNPSDEREIERMLQFFCELTLVESWNLDPQGLIDIEGDISIICNRLTQGHLPLAFGSVTGSFIARNCDLITLAGAPHSVGESILVTKNQLHDLKGGPEFVGNKYMVMDNPLTSLEGLATHVKDSLWMNYTPDLPLLRLVQVPHVFWHMNHMPPPEVKTIIDTHVGKGKGAVLNFALELKKAGFVENARW